MAPRRCVVFQESVDHLDCCRTSLELGPRTLNPDGAGGGGKRQRLPKYFCRAHPAFLECTWVKSSVNKILWVVYLFVCSLLLYHCTVSIALQTCFLSPFLEGPLQESLQVVLLRDRAHKYLGFCLRVVVLVFLFSLVSFCRSADLFGSLPWARVGGRVGAMSFAANLTKIVAGGGWGWSGVGRVDRSSWQLASLHDGSWQWPSLCKPKRVPQI